jgi:hypothetical protein
MTPVIVGAALALAALAWVMEPIFRRSHEALRDGVDAEPSTVDVERRELALDVATGRLSREEFRRRTGG